MAETKEKSVKRTVNALAQQEVIKLARKGKVTPREVVDYARNPDTALHNLFEWDDSYAAELYRLEQARNVIRCCVTVLPGTDKNINVFVSMMEDRRNDDGYSLLVEVLSDSDRREKLLNQAFYEFNIFQRKYDTLIELASVFSAMSKAKKIHSRGKKNG